MSPASFSEIQTHILIYLVDGSLHCLRGTSHLAFPNELIIGVFSFIRAKYLRLTLNQFLLSLYHVFLESVISLFAYLLPETKVP